MSSFSRFQTVNQNRIVANKDTNTSFVFNAYNTTTLTKFYPLTTTDTEPITIIASVVNKQEKDLAYIYIAPDSDLNVGSVWGAKGLKWLIAEEIVVIKDVKWKKYLAFLCNVEINDLWGFFKGPEKTFIDISLKENVLLQSQQHPILILPSGSLDIGKRIMLGGRAWLVQEKDNLSSVDVDYYSLKQTTMDKEYNAQTQEWKNKEEGSVQDALITTPSFILEETLIDGVYYIAPDQEITLDTEEAFFRTSNNAVEVISLSATKVSFKLPFVSDEEIQIKIKEQGQEVIKRFKAVV